MKRNSILCRLIASGKVLEGSFHQDSTTFICEGTSDGKEAIGDLVIHRTQIHKLPVVPNCCLKLLSPNHCAKFHRDLIVMEFKTVLNTSRKIRFGFVFNYINSEL